jgi:RNA polymerase sigma-70 factor (ECF subfamily)
MEEAFYKLYEEMFPKLKRIAMIKLRDEHKAEDIAQDTLIVAYDKREQVFQFPEPKKWVYGVLHKKLKHEFRSKARFALMMNKLERGFQEEQATDCNDGWEELLDGLTCDEYQLLKMIYVEGYSNKEAAEKLNIPYDRCRKQVQRAKERIRSKYQ